jgi:hypothetical protein
MNQPGEQNASSRAEAILAGTVAAGCLILLILGSGLGWFPRSAWTLDSAIATFSGLSMILWISLRPLFISASSR